MPGSAAVAMWWDVPREAQSEWEEWHTCEHMPERLAIPGFLRGSRWVCESSYFVLYELEDAATLTGPAYLERLNNPTPWSRKMMPHHKNMVRSLCLVRAGYGDGVASAMATIRFSPGDGMATLPSGKGVTGARLLQSQPLPATTEEQRIRGGDAGADWVLLISGYDAQAVERTAAGLSLRNAAIGSYRLSYSLSRP
jgi:hypothetical protein